MFDCHYKPSTGRNLNALPSTTSSVYFFVDILHFFFIISNLVYCQTQYIWKLICHFVFFSASSLKSFQKAAHHLVSSPCFLCGEFLLGDFTHQQSVTYKCCCCILCCLSLQHLWSFAVASQLPWQQRLLQSWICFGGFSEWESDPGWTLSAKVHRGYVASRGSNQPVSHLSNCVCRHLCLKRFSNRVKAPNGFHTLKITKSSVAFDLLCNLLLEN